MHPTELPKTIPTILDAWRTHLRPPGEDRPRRDERGAAEQALTAALIRAGLSPRDDDAALRTVVLSAANYGRLQHARRLDPDEIVRELACLRTEVWQLVCDHDTDAEEARDFITRVDAAISVAIAAVVSAGTRERKHG